MQLHWKHFSPTISRHLLYHPISLSLSLSKRKEKMYVTKRKIIILVSSQISLISRVHHVFKFLSSAFTCRAFICYVTIAAFLPCNITITHTKGLGTKTNRQPPRQDPEFSRMTWLYVIGSRGPTFFWSHYTLQTRIP